MALGILDLLGLGASLIFALPLAGYGIQRAVGGEPLVGAVFVGIAALMVYIPQRVTTPGDIPGKLFGGAVGSAVTVPEEEGETETEAENGKAAADRE